MPTACEAEGKTCKKQVQALCYHCSKNLCRIHLTQHAQLIEENIQLELNSLADKFNELISKFDHLSISNDILEKPLLQLEKWRIEAHSDIDQIAVLKRHELNDELDKYRKVFHTKNEEQLAKIKTSQKIIQELMAEADASAKQMADLQRSIDEAKNYLNALNAPLINVIARSSNWAVGVSTNFFGFQSASIDELRKFKITYIQRNGLIQDYYIITKKNGRMSDLIASFIRHCTTIKESAQIETNQAYINEHLPKFSFIIPTIVYKNSIKLQLDKNSWLKNISDRHEIVFYQTAYAIDQQDNPSILMPCRFRRLLNETPFGWPIYLNVPRTGCRGQHVLDALHDSLEKFFSFKSDTDQHLYNASFQYTNNYLIISAKLNDALQDEINVSKTDMTLVVDIDRKLADKYKTKQSEKDQVIVNGIVRFFFNTLSLVLIQKFL